MVDQGPTPGGEPTQAGEPESTGDPAPTEEPTPATPAEGRLIHQAEVPPLDVDGVQAASIGIVLFAGATAVLALGYDRLVAVGDGWWLGVAVSGLALGVLGLAYTIARRRRRRARSQPGPAGASRQP